MPSSTPRRPFKAAPFSSSSCFLTFSELCDAYHLTTDCCHLASNSSAQSKRCRASPNCLHGLKGKKGIWDTNPAPLKALGPDPAVQRREPGTLVGLTNLGATCYMNTLLQALFMNSYFRHTLYRFRSSSSIPFPSPSSSSPLSPATPHPDAIVLHLQELFGLLEFGPCSYQNPSTIARELGLNAHEQQDINEFNNLFLSHLEQRLRTCEALPGAEQGEVERVRTLVASEFTGESVSVVRCLVCGTESSRPSSFLDVSLLIKGKKSVVDCLHALMDVEHLHRDARSDNRYYCSQCAAKCDADRRTRFSKLPPVLNLQLIRFDYDAESGQKKKINDRIFIPYTLHMNQFLDLPPQPNAPQEGEGEYELTAVLRHKGSSAHRGHYTCEVRDAKGTWWIFDDEKVGLGGSHFNARGDAAGARVPVATAEKGEEKTGDSKKKRKKKAALTFKKRAKTVDEGQGQGLMTDYMAVALEVRESKEQCVEVLDDDVQVVGDEKGGAGERMEEEVVLDDSREAPGQQRGKDGDCSSNAYMLVYTQKSRVLADAAAATAAGEAAAKGGQRKRAEESKESTGGAVGIIEPPSFICDCHSSCAPPTRVKTAIETSYRRLADELASFESRKAQLMEKVEQRKKEVESLIPTLDAPPITPASASEYQRRLRPPSKGPAVHVIDSDEEEVKEVRRGARDEDEDEMAEESAEPFYFIHVGWLQRWLMGQTEREWSDAQAEKIGRGEAKSADAHREGAAAGHDRSEAIVLDEDDSDEGRVQRISPSPSDHQQIVVTDDEKADDEELQITSHHQPSSSSPALISPRASSATTSPPPWSSASPSPFASLLDNTDPLYPGDLFESVNRLQCEHGRLDPHSHNRLRTKRISVHAWNTLKKQNAESQRLRSAFLTNAGCPPPPPHPEVDLDEGSLCSDCVVRLKAAEQTLLSQREEFDSIIERMKEFTTSAAKSVGAFTEGEWSESGLLLDRVWYRELVERVKRHKQKAYSAVPLQAGGDEDINKGLKCEHGALVINKQDRAYLISPDLWHAHFIRLWPHSTTISVMEPECERCTQEDAQAMSVREELRLRLEEEQKLPGLKRFIGSSHHDHYPDTKRPLRPGRYYILPARWVLREFIPYQQQVVVNSSLPIKLDRPSPVPISSLLCPHQLLRLHPVPKSLTARKPELLPGIDVGEVTVCEANVWTALQELGYAGGRKQEEEMTAVYVDATAAEVGDDVSIDNDWEQLQLSFTPALCHPCIEARVNEEMERLHYFTDGYLLIKRVSKTVPLSSASGSTGQTSMTSFLVPGRTRRKRAVSAIEEFTAYHVDAADDVMTVKMKVSQYCNYSPAQLRLYWNEEELKEGKKLSEYGVTNGGELLMKVDVDGGDRDFMDYLPTDDAVFPHNHDVESGFAGTRLATGGGGGGGGGAGGKPQADRQLLPRLPADSAMERSKLAAPSAPSCDAPLLPRLLDGSSASPPRSASSPVAAASVSLPSGFRCPRPPSASPPSGGFLSQVRREMAAEESRFKTQAQDEMHDFRVAQQLQEQEDREAAARRQKMEQSEAASRDLIHQLKGERQADRLAGIVHSSDEEVDAAAEEEEEGEDEHGSDDDWQGTGDDPKESSRRKSTAKSRRGRLPKAAKGTARKPAGVSSRRGSGKGGGGGRGRSSSSSASRGASRSSRSDEEDCSDFEDDSLSAEEEENGVLMGGEERKESSTITRAGRRVVGVNGSGSSLVFPSLFPSPAPSLFSSSTPSVSSSASSPSPSGINWLTGGKPQAEPRPPPPPIRPPARARVDSRAAFSCSSCTYNNPVGRDTCFMCGRPHLHTS